MEISCSRKWLATLSKRERRERRTENSRLDAVDRFVVQIEQPDNFVCVSGWEHDGMTFKSLYAMHCLNIAT